MKKTLAPALLLTSLLPLTGCLFESDKADLEVDVKPLQTAYRPGDSLMVEGSLRCDDWTSISLGEAGGTTLGLRYVMKGGKELQPGAYDIRKDIGIGLVVPADACGKEVSFTVYVTCGIENTRSSFRRDLRTRIDAPACPRP